MVVKRNKTKLVAKENKVNINGMETRSRKRLIEEISKEVELKIVPSQRESDYEAYHAVFSMLLGTADNVYQAFTQVCGSQEYWSKPDAKRTIMTTKPDINIIFNDGGDETHYRFYFGKGNKEIFDPYVYFQVYLTHGNCFAYALYLSSKLTQSPERHCELFPKPLINISKYIYHVELPHDDDPYVEFPEWVQLLTVDGREITHQKLYQYYVYNDYAIVSNIMHIIRTVPEIYALMNTGWDELTDEQREEADIPLDKKYNFEIYLQQFDKLLNPKYTYLLTAEKFKDDWYNKSLFNTKLKTMIPNFEYFFTKQRINYKDYETEIKSLRLNCAATFYRGIILSLKQFNERVQTEPQAQQTTGGRRRKTKQRRRRSYSHRRKTQKRK